MIARRTSWSLVLLALLLSACASPSRAPHPDELEFSPLVFQVPEVEKAEMDNGIRLYLREDHELPLVQITAMVGVGAITETASEAGLGQLFASSLRTGGTEVMSPDDLDAALEQMAADFSVSTGTYVTTLDLSLQADDLEEGLRILGSVLRRPRFDPTRLELARRQAIEGIRRQNDNPDSIARRVVMAALYGDHPLGVHPTIESVTSIRRQNLIELHQRFFHPNNLWLAVSGDFDRDELQRILAANLGDWPRKEFVPQEVPPVPEPGEGRVLVVPKDLVQTTILLGEIGIEKSNTDLHAVRVMNYILGGGGFNSRLMREIRSDRGLAYSAFSFYRVGRRLPAPFMAGSETQSSTTMKVVGLMEKIMEEMRSQPVSQKELEVAKESQINSFVFAFTDSHDIVTQTMRLDYFDYPEDYLSRYRDRIAAVTIEDVLRAAQTYLHPDRQMVVLVGNTDDFDAPPSSLERPVERVSLEE